VKIALTLLRLYFEQVELFFAICMIIGGTWTEVNNHSSTPRALNLPDTKFESCMFEWLADMIAVQTWGE
jgi:hypothetical protein